MHPSDVPRAVAAARALAAELGLAAERADVLQTSNRITMRLLPCDTVARVAQTEHQPGAEFEVALARQLTAAGGPVAALDPRAAPQVYVRGGFAVTLWAYYEPLPPREVAPAEYARALAALHAAMRQVSMPTPHVADRVGEAQRLVAGRELTPELPDADRELLGGALRDLRRVVEGHGSAEQPLHGEPHPGNIIRTKDGLRFVDLETCCRGPVEFDLAYAPEESAAHYPGADPELVRACRTLALALVTAWRWDRDDRFPDGRRMGVAMLRELRAALAGGPG